MGQVLDALGARWEGGRPVPDERYHDALAEAMIPLTVPEIQRLLAAALARPSPPGHADD